MRYGDQKTKPSWVGTGLAGELLFWITSNALVLLMFIYFVWQITSNRQPVLKPAEQELSAFYRLPDEIQAAKGTYAAAHGIPQAATLTEEQLQEILTPLYADHPRNDEGNFVSSDPWEFIEVPRQVDKRPVVVVRTY